jgi:hypothetical protein
MSCKKCRKYFRDLSILPLRSQYIYSLMIFVVKNKEMFDSNNFHYEINTRHITDINDPSKSGDIRKGGKSYGGKDLQFTTTYT